MPDSRSHRGLHPQDAALFAPSWLPVLRTATEEFSWLLSRGYAPLSSLKLVGDRHALRERQRDLVLRASCTDEQRANRSARRLMPPLPPDQGTGAMEAVPAVAAGRQDTGITPSASGQTSAESDETTDAFATSTTMADAPVYGADWFIDGFNLLITLEAALGGGLVFRARDGALRDLASVHDTYRSVEETDDALLLAGETLAEFRPASVTWLFDAPVSNSGRIAQRVRALAESRQWPWEVRLSKNPDQELMSLQHGIVVTTDSLILDHVRHGWFPLSEQIITRLPPGFLYLDFGA
ncbi:MAG: hypothetical protein JWM59_4333 [Verrucomicrobiales bacterium]|nr:hypothetical protein [Verrucomicrobiales bacterium]